MGFNMLTCMSLVGAPSGQIEHLMAHQELLMVHLRQLKVLQNTADGRSVSMKQRFLDKFSREFGNKSVLYEIISMSYYHKSALYEIISMR